jgi:hypothetical protein
MTPTTTFETKTPFDTKLACATPNESSDLFVRVVRCGRVVRLFWPEVLNRIHPRQDAAVQAARAARVAASFTLRQNTTNPNLKRAATTDASQGGDDEGGCEQGGRRVERAAAQGALHSGRVGYWRRGRSDASDIQRRRGEPGKGAPLLTSAPHAPILCRTTGEPTLG